MNLSQIARPVQSWEASISEAKFTLQLAGCREVRRVSTMAGSHSAAVRLSLRGNSAIHDSCTTVGCLLAAGL